jgi:hypothetical protein
VFEPDWGMAKLPKGWVMMGMTRSDTALTADLI